MKLPFHTHLFDFPINMVSLKGKTTIEWDFLFFILQIYLDWSSIRIEPRREGWLIPRYMNCRGANK